MPEVTESEIADPICEGLREGARGRTEGGVAYGHRDGYRGGSVA